MWNIGNRTGIYERYKTKHGLYSTILHVCIHLHQMQILEENVFAIFKLLAKRNNLESVKFSSQAFASALAVGKFLCRNPKLKEITLRVGSPK